METTAPWEHFFTHISAAKNESEPDSSKIYSHTRKRDNLHVYKQIAKKEKNRKVFVFFIIFSSSAKLRFYEIKEKHTMMNTVKLLILVFVRS